LAAKNKSVFREYAEAIIVAAILALFIRTFIVQAFKIPSGSMKNTLLVGDHLLVNKFLYGTHIPFTHIILMKIRDPKRGDIMVFKYPEDESKDFIKRVIGTPGDVVQIIAKKVYINGKPLPEPYTIYRDDQILPKSLDPRDNFGPILVPPHEYFMMGDNRDRSRDSRYWGFVDESKIIGKAIILYWSWDGDGSSIRWNRIGRIVN
jgi:signal peptidase I